MADLFTSAESGSGDGGGRRLTREDPPTNVWSTPRVRGEHFFPFDLESAKAKPGPAFKVSDNAVMSPKEFRGFTEQLLTQAGCLNEVPTKQWAVLRAIFMAHVINSASQKVENRAEIEVEGMSRPLSYKTDVMDVLKVDARRYFRAAAPHIMQELKRMFKITATASEDEFMIIETVQRHAHERGLAKYPWLAFDAADMLPLSLISPAEFQAVQASKAQRVEGGDSDTYNIPVGSEVLNRAAQAKVTSNVGGYHNL